MSLLQTTGAITIPVSGMPGSACVYRLMMYPDGRRLGAREIIEGTRHSLSVVAGMLTDIDAARELITGMH
jgi:L-seryl-tRNA(Ser) seleniumtransferase